MNTKATGLPDLDTATPERDAGEVHNSRNTKLAVVIFVVLVLAGAGVAMKTLLFTPETTPAAAADPATGAGKDIAATAAAGGPAQVAAPLPLSGANPPDAPPGRLDLIQTRLDRVEDGLTGLASTQDSLRQDMAASADAVQARLTGLESTLAALTSRIDALRQTGDSDALARFTAQLQRFNQRLIHVERRSRENRKELHGDTGARRRGASLPFHVTAIDWWDGQPSVVIRSAKGEAFLSEGEAFSGWKLVSVDPGGGQVRFTRNGRDAVAQVGR